MATLEDVYRKFGEVAEAAQLLETELGNILILLGAAEADLFEQPDPQKGADLIRGINRQTLGQLLKRLGNSTESAAHLESILSAALLERNRLSHSFYREHNFRRNTAEGCMIMLDDLERMHKAILEAYIGILRLSDPNLDSFLVHGVPSEHVPI